ncbi:MAG TPA: efflux RND transporter permease subunit [Candidatus Thermoplasmatota archaeon]|nr:efflux RND transporter permease subunit [Candidatus Thermoplasmatota archaeon]
MLEQLGRIIEKRPWLVVGVILLITIGFSLFIPSLTFKTNFEDFAPDNEQVRANERIADYFGMSDQTIILYIQKEQTDSIISVQALRDQYELQKELTAMPEVEGTISIFTFLDPVCQMEFNRTVDTCSDEQLKIAVNDLLNEPVSGNMTIFQTDDPNEPIDYQRSFLRSSGRAVDSADIKNCYILKDNKTLTFSFEVYSLSDFSSNLKPPLSKVSTMEWYLDFKNSLLPSEYDMGYQIAARIEPTVPRWEIGNGLLGNIKQFIQNIRNHELTSYKKTAYLWLRPPGQEMFFPLQLKTGNVTFNQETNRINVIVSRKELSGYGIALQVGSFELPTKLTNFSAGVRYYRTPVLHRPGGRIVINTSYLFDRLQRLQSRPVLGSLISRMLQRFDINLDDFSGLSENMTGTGFLPSTFSLSAIQTLWVQADRAPDSGVSTTIYPLIPELFSELRVNALSFISNEYSQTNTSHASLCIVQLNLQSGDAEELAKVNDKIIDKINDLNRQYTSISTQATGEGIVTTQINDVAMDAMTIIGPAIFIIILCILFIAFRKPSYIILPVIVFAFSCVWLFGTMALLGISFNIIAVALLPLNIGLGVEYSVNLLFNYRTEINKGRTPAEAIRLSIKEVGIAIFLAWFTTFVAFLSFLSATLPPVRDFGIFLALGITYTFIITMTLLVALRYIIDRRKPAVHLTSKEQTSSMTIIMSRVAHVLLRHEKKVFLATILICLVMGTAVTQLKSGFSMNQFIPQDNPAIQLFTQIGEDFPFSSQDQEYILIEGNVATVQTLRGLQTTHEKMNDDLYVARRPDGSTKTESIFTLIQQAVANNHSLVELFNIDEETGLPRTDTDVQHAYDYLYESAEYEMQVAGLLRRDGDEYTATILRVYVDLGSDSDDMTEQFEQLNAELTDDLSEYGDTTSIITGNLLITLSILKNMTESQILSTGICFVLAAIMLTLIYRNPLLGLIAMIPVTISIIWVLGSMYFIGYTLNILTITVTSITIGVGIDYACYITERFRLVADQTGDVTKAVTETISRTGSAVLIAALSSMFGFGVLAFAPIPPEQQFGIITAITLTYAFITSILVLPLVLARWAYWRKKRKGYIISPGPPKKLDGIQTDSEYSGEQ